MSAIREHLLDNGMTLLCWHQPHLHGVEFGLYLKGGPVYETEESQGVSHLLEHLCFRGLGGLDHDQLQRTLNRFGAEMDGMTAAEAIVFRMTVLPQFFDGALDPKWIENILVAAVESARDRRIEHQKIMARAEALKKEARHG